MDLPQLISQQLRHIQSELESRVSIVSSVFVSLSSPDNNESVADVSWQRVCFLAFCLALRQP